MPDFFDSEWFVPEVDNWHLKPGAPPEIIEEFEEYMKTHKITEDTETIVD